MEPTYESIKSLIVEENWIDNQVKLQIKASNQKNPIETMGMAMMDPEEMNKRIMAEMAKSAASSIAINTAGNALGNLTGVAGAGSAINSVASHAGVGYQMDMAKIMMPDMTDELKKKTVVDAFKNLAMYYKFENNEWIYIEPKTN